MGGLSIAREAASQLPRERLLYYADSARAPWGTRTPEQIREFASEITAFLIEQEAKLILVACNTASVHALKHLRATFPDTPFVGTVPAVKPAAKATRTGRIGVLATGATASGKALADLVSEFVIPENVHAEVVVPSGLVELVEAGQITGPETEQVIRDCVEPMIENGVDTLVLGCTHFPFVAPVIDKISRGRLLLVDAAQAVVRQCGRVLDQRSLAAPPDAPYQGLQAMTVYTSGDAAAVAATVKNLLGFAPEIQLIR